MASNHLIYSASFLYSLILVLNSCSYEPSSIFEIIRWICHLLPTITNKQQTPIDYTNFSLIYSYVMKGAFVYSIAMVFLSTTMTFASYSSFRELATAITRHWKPFLASILAAIIIPAILRPPSTFAPFETYFIATLFHASFVAYFSVKLVTMPMLEAKFGKDMEVPINFSRWIIFWQISLSVMQIVTLYLSKEAYKMQLVFGIVCEVIHLIWLASFYELIVFTVLIYELKKKKKKKKQLAEAGTRSSKVTETLAPLLDERLP